MDPNNNCLTLALGIHQAFNSDFHDVLRWRLIRKFIWSFVCVTCKLYLYISNISYYILILSIHMKCRRKYTIVLCYFIFYKAILIKQFIKSHLLMSERIGTFNHSPTSNGNKETFKIPRLRHHISPQALQ